MELRKIIDTVVTLILCGVVLFGCIYFVTLYVIAKEKNSAALLADELSNMIEKGEQEIIVRSDEEDPIVRHYLSRGTAALNDILASSNVCDVEAEAVMFNVSMGVDLPSLDEYHRYNLKGSSGTVYTNSDEYLKSIPAVKTSFTSLQNNCRYSIYMVGVDVRHTPSFCKEYQLSYDAAEHGRIFLIEKEEIKPSRPTVDDFIYYQLSTNIIVERSKGLSPVYEIVGYSLPFTIEKT